MNFLFHYLLIKSINCDLFDAVDAKQEGHGIVDAFLSSFQLTLMTHLKRNADVSIVVLSCLIIKYLEVGQGYRVIFTFLQE